MDELKARKRILRRLDLIDDRDVITLKGRVACEISSGDELMLTEMLFQGIFNDIDVAQIVAVLSCFVFDEKTDEEPLLKTEMEKTIEAMKDMARKIRDISTQSKLEQEPTKPGTNEDDELIKTDFMDIAYMWAKGVKFHELCKKTKIFEGAIIRCFRRLEELLRSMGAASRVIGNTELEMKFAEGKIFYSL
jgi:ATP-dependent RNA helicase DOB1